MIKSSSNLIKVKSKCPHKHSKTPNKHKHTDHNHNYYTNNQYTNQYAHNHPNIKPKQLPLKNNQNLQSNYELCKQATLCYYGMKEVMKIQTLEKQSKKLKQQNHKLKEENKIYEQYFKQFQTRYQQQKQQIKKLKQQNYYLKHKNPKVQQLNSTLTGNTPSARSHSHKQSFVAKSLPKYMY